jgi:hypothetical protein
MDSSIIQKYKFREHSDGVMVGGFSMQNILTVNDMGSKEQLEGFSVPVGLYVSTTSDMKGGSEQTQPKTIFGGTIDDERFEKLYGGIVQRVVKKPSKTQKKR